MPARDHVIRSQRRKRLEREEAAAENKSSEPVLVIWAVDESEEEAYARAGIDFATYAGEVVVIRRFCQTVAEDRAQRGLED